ncbi:MAG: Fe-S cluster assembly protein SufD [candidate division Zixibacteria bacterium]|nr:Fe-S cluster assembly protein SufD [candidate division Zixibacteria bacterium]
MTVKVVDRTKSSFRIKDNNEPEWLYNLRNDAWCNFNKPPMPEIAKHLWKYSNPTNFMLVNQDEHLRLGKRYPQIAQPEEFDPEKGVDAYWGNSSDLKVKIQTTEDFKDSGVVFQELHLASKNHEELVKRYLGKLVTFELGKFEALNMAMWDIGAFLYIPDNTVIKNPIYLHRHPTGINTVTRLLVIMGKNAEATIVDDYRCGRNKGISLVNSAVEIFADDASRVRYINLQRLATDYHSFITQRTHLARDAESYTLFASVGSGVSKINAGTILDGRGAHSNMYGVAFGDNRQQFDHHTVHHHKSSDSYSNIDLKTVMKDKSSSAYTGLIKIEKEAPNCEAYQENRNLLLNKKARVETIPELEILTDQVRCSHGATVGPLDEETVFYLTSRGISRAEAIKSIVAGFVEPTLAKMPKSVGESVRKIVLEKLEER